MNERTFMKSRLLVLSLCFIGLLFVFAGSSYAYITVLFSQKNNNVVEVGNLKLSYNDNDKLLNVNNAFPTSDEDGLTQDGYTFTVTNTGSLASNYKVMIANDTALIKEDECGSNLLSYDNLRFSLDSNVPITLGEVDHTPLSEEETNDGYTIATGHLNPSESVTYVLRMWIDKESGNEILGKHFHGKIVVEGAQGEIIHVDKSGANPPKLAEGMIAVKYDETGKKWVKADLAEEWYDYTKWNWANAVTVVPEKREMLMNAKAGTEIPMDAINTMWVWIPRYEYKYTEMATLGTNKETPGMIDVKFIKGIDNVPTSNEYMVHPAFTFGTESLEGFWYGKFETSSKEECTATNYDVDKNCDVVKTYTPQIKPGVTSWRGIRTSTAFLVSQEMNANKTYGFNKTSDVHMSKDNEWGAVAYLSQSTYGKQGNSAYSGADKEVYMNKSTTYITGSSNGTPSTGTAKEGAQYAYDDLTSLGDGKGLAGPGASTTGTIYGVYDMSGGAWERVMNVMEDEDGLPRSGQLNYNSGYSGKLSNGTYYEGRELPELKYYSTYGNGSIAATGCNGGACLGEALSETAAWYGDYTTWLTSTYPWLVRGGGCSDDAGAGVFSFISTSGHAHVVYSFRLVLTP